MDEMNYLAIWRSEKYVISRTKPGDKIIVANAKEMNELIGNFAWPASFPLSPKTFNLIDLDRM